MVLFEVIFQRFGPKLTTEIYQCRYVVLQGVSISSATVVQCTKSYGDWGIHFSVNNKNIITKHVYTRSKKEELLASVHESSKSLLRSLSLSLSFPVGGTGHRPDLLQEAP